MAYWTLSNQRVIFTSLKLLMSCTSITNALTQITRHKVIFSHSIEGQPHYLAIDCKQYRKERSGIFLQIHYRLFCYANKNSVNRCYWYDSVYLQAQISVDIEQVFKYQNIDFTLSSCFILPSLKVASVRVVLHISLNSKWAFWILMIEFVSWICMNLCHL